MAVATSPVRAAGVRAAGVALFLSFMDVTVLVTIVAGHAAALGAGALGVGLAVGAYSATNLPANIVGGILLDRLGRRRLTVIGFLLNGLAVLGYALASTVPAFILIRAFHGVVGGIHVTAVFAMAGDRTRAGRAGRSFGRYGAVIGTAWIVGPALAAILTARSGFGLAFQVVAALQVLGAVVTLLFLPDVRADEDRDPTAGADAVTDARSSTVMRELASRPAVRRALLATIAWMAAVGTLAAFLRETVVAVGLDESISSALFSMYALLAALVMLSPLSARVDRRGGDGMIAAGLGTIAVALGLMAAAGSVPFSGFAVLMLASAIFGAGYGVIFPAVAGAVSLAATTRTRGRAFGLFNVAFSVGLALGPPAVGALVLGSEALTGRSGALHPFLPVAVLCAVTALAVRRAGRADAAGTVATAP
jgi:DHA1 family multidrug resistance protein-like MFS transporter